MEESLALVLAKLLTASVFRYSTVGKYFLKLTEKHFKHDNIQHRIFNRKTLKISYSCTKNIFQIINNHNKEIIKEFQD